MFRDAGALPWLREQRVEKGEAEAAQAAADNEG